MKIALDIGHADGTGAKWNGFEEHAVAKRIALSLAVMLDEAGHEIDVIDYPEKTNRDDLNETIRVANRGGYDFGVSIHCDYSDTQNAHGAHVCYMSTSGLQLAQAIADHLCDRMPGRADKVVKRNDLAVLKQTKAVWALVECGFISNSHDAAIMAGAPNYIAQEIYHGIMSYSNGRKNRNS